MYLIGHLRLCLYCYIPVINLSGYSYILRLAFDELALTKAIQPIFGKEDTGIVDIKALRIPETVFTLPSLLKYRELFRVLLVESLLDCLV